MKYANLHLHSTFSDAQFTPEQLLLIGKSLGYGAMALTDHETDGGVRRLMKYAREQGGVDVISGVEFCGSYEGTEPHITALDYDMDNNDFRAFVKLRCDQREECTRKRFEIGVRDGLIQEVTWNDVLDVAEELSYICIDTVFAAFRKKNIPIPSDIRAKCFNSPEAKTYSVPYPSPEFIIKLIRNAGGIATLAHPENQLHFVPQFVEWGLNGIEVCHPDLSATTEIEARKLAKEYNLYMSGGTDHTGPMSGCGGEHAVPVFNGISEEEYFAIKERRLK